jgi:hypothetical protein
LGDFLGHGRGAKVGSCTEGRVDDEFASGGHVSSDVAVFTS